MASIEKTKNQYHSFQELMFDSIDEFTTNFHDFEQQMQHIKEAKSEFIETFNPTVPHSQ